MVELELTTVADDEVVAYAGSEVRRWRDLAPGAEHLLDGLVVRTLERPGGELLATVATANDLHFGEVECGVVEGSDVGPVLRSEPGETPYPELMNRAAVAEMLALQEGAGPDAVVVKGDLTAAGTQEEYDAFLSCYEPAFGARLHHVRGNHESYHHAPFAAVPTAEVSLAGVTLAILDTSRDGATAGKVSSEQLEWLDELGARADRPVLVFGHHHVWDPGSRTRPAGYFGVNPDDSDHLIEVVARRPSLVGYFAGHTHRNRVRRFPATGDVPWAEVSAVKDFPGGWAEYRVYEGGILQVFRRVSSPAALAWTDRTRAMYGGLYAGYAFGRLEDRCFAIATR
ncbi:MAG: metallophosphoesterase [Acidimicrobiales bacterium]